MTAGKPHDGRQHQGHGYSTITAAVVVFLNALIAIDRSKVSSKASRKCRSRRGCRDSRDGS